MIARFTIELPYTFDAAQHDELSPYEFEQPPHRVRIYPPTHEEKGTGRTVNLLQIDFLRQEFDRRLEAPLDPPYTLAVEVANRFLARLRLLTRRSYLKPLLPDEAEWRMFYLTDDGQRLPEDPALKVGNRTGSVSFRPCLLDDAWSVLPMLAPDYVPPLWDVLLLDAEALLPEVGPALVAAYTALETFITWTLDELAALPTAPAKFWPKKSLVAERFDRILQALAGQSLKNEPALWDGFEKLRAARNTFAHEGTPTTGGKKGGIEVTLQEAQQLIGHAKAIITWVEALLPEAKRRPKAPSRPRGGWVFHVPLY